METNELADWLKDFNSRMCESGGRVWSLRIPADESDPDMMLSKIEACLRALQSQIDGMIKRPVVETRFDDNDKKYKLTIHGEPIISSSLGDHNYIYNVAVRIRKALGMDDSTNTEEPQ